ncbi:hypothetical protein JB92DRAFT_3100058 [Gautieria morchelliformis]|nr:hypothetical protein JB92DRAFT_3100058 [Gautieria morchelliformis]
MGARGNRVISGSERLVMEGAERRARQLIVAHIELVENKRLTSSYYLHLCHCCSALPPKSQWKRLAWVYINFNEVPGPFADKLGFPQLFDTLSHSDTEITVLGQLFDTLSRSDTEITVLENTAEDENDRENYIGFALVITGKVDARDSRYTSVELPRLRLKGGEGSVDTTWSSGS